LEIFFGVYAYGVVVGGFDVDVDSIFQEAELFEALGLFECARGEAEEAVEGGFAVGVEADVLPILRCGVGADLSVVGAPVAVVGDGGAGEVEGAAVVGGDDFDGVGVGDVLRRAEDFESGDYDVRFSEGSQERGEVLGFEERLVTLNVDVDVGGEELRHGVDAVGSAWEVGGGELDGPIVLMAEIGDLCGVCRDDNAGELRAGDGGFVDPGEHGAAGDGTKDFARQARGGEAGRDDAEDGGRALFDAFRIKYDGNWLCRGDVSHSTRICAGVPNHTSAV
jgi:hypothetical protein